MQLPGVAVTPVVPQLPSAPPAVVITEVAPFVTPIDPRPQQWTIPEPYSPTSPDPEPYSPTDTNKYPYLPDQAAMDAAMYSSCFGDGPYNDVEMIDCPAYDLPGSIADLSLVRDTTAQFYV